MNRTMHSWPTLLPTMFVAVFLTTGHTWASPPVPVWEAYYTGPGDGEDTAYDLAIDGSGNVYVTGETAVDLSDTDMITIKYSADGETLWTATYDGPGDDGDRGLHIALDESGHVYVLGESDGGESRSDIVLIQYDAEGNERWTVRHDGDDHNWDTADGLAVDADGNAVMAGTVWVSGHSPDDDRDFLTVKYAPDGTELWRARYDGPGQGRDIATALAVDADGNVVVVGDTYTVVEGSSTSDYATIQYGPDGEERWVALYDGPLGCNDEAHALAIDGDGNVHVTGGAIVSSGQYYNYRTIKYDPDGHALWVADFNSIQGEEDIARAIAVDEAGNVYVHGRVWLHLGSSSHGYHAAAKYDADGNRLWVRRSGVIGWGSGAVIPAIVVDGNGNAYTVGYSLGLAWRAPFLFYHPSIIKYNADGERVWAMALRGPLTGVTAYGLAVDDDGHVYVAGDTNVNGYDHSLFTGKYSQDPACFINAAFCGRRER